MKIVNSDQWFTPTGIIEDLANEHIEPHVIDYCTCPEAAARTEQVMPVYGDAMTLSGSMNLRGVQFCNPPYSRASGGARKFVEKLAYRHEHNYFLLNYSNWIAQVVDEMGGILGLFDKRVRFDPGSALMLERIAQGKDPAPESPRYNNAILYFGDRVQWQMPQTLGGYRVRWFQS